MSNEAPPSEFAHLEAAALAVREFRGSAATRAVDDLLAQLERHTLHTLATVNPDELRFRQGALRQLKALRLIVSGEELEDGRVC